MINQRIEKNMIFLLLICIGKKINYLMSNSYFVFFVSQQKKKNIFDFHIKLDFFKIIGFEGPHLHFRAPRSKLSSQSSLPLRHASFFADLSAPNGRDQKSFSVDS